MADKHEVVFQWPHPEPNTVIVTGTFDNWAKKIHLTKGPTGFHGSTGIPWNEKIAYKFLVDGEWMLLEDEPTEADRDGNINNIYTAPPLADVIPSVAKPTTDISAGSSLELQPQPIMNATSEDIIVYKPVDDPAPPVENTIGTLQNGSAHKAESSVTPVDGETGPSGHGSPEQPERAVTPKPDSSVTHTVEGNQPDLSGTNTTPDQIDEALVLGPVYDDGYNAFEDHTSPSPGIVNFPIAPIVPIYIIPVNAPENNTIPREAPFFDAHPTIHTHGTIAPSKGSQSSTNHNREPTAVSLPPNTKDSNSETPIGAEPRVDTTTGSPDHVEKLEGNGIEGNGIEVKEGVPLPSSPEASEDVDDSVPSPPATHSVVVADKPASETVERSLVTPPPPHDIRETPVPADKPSPEPLHTNGTLEQNGNHTTEPPTAIEEMVDITPSPNSKDPHVSAANAGKAEPIRAEEASTPPQATKDSATQVPTQPIPEPVAGKTNGSAPSDEAEKPKTNGQAIPIATSPVPEQTKPAAPASPITPTKNSKHSFPSAGSPSASPSSSRFNSSEKPRKKRESFLSKVKHIFAHDKHDKNKEGKK